MPNLLVVPHEVFVMLQDGGVNLAKLNDINYMAEHLSASDIADIHSAQVAFPFAFDQTLNINMLRSPLTDLQTNEKYQDLYYRVNGRIETNSIREGSGVSQNAHVFSLYPVEENLWIVVQEKMHNVVGDPSRLLLKANQNFFDSMIAQCLHTLSFEEVCSTDLFTYYLGSL